MADLEAGMYGGNDTFSAQNSPINFARIPMFCTMAMARLYAAAYTHCNPARAGRLGFDDIFRLLSGREGLGAEELLGQ